MLHRLSFLTLLGVIFLSLARPSQAANIHLRYFESADAILEDSQFQLFSLAALQDEEVTIVAYGLQEAVIPGIAFFDRQGRTIAENRNLDNQSGTSVQVVIPENGIFTFLVSRQTEVIGSIRVMVFVGDPLRDDLSLLDTIDPLLPNRAFLIGGAEGDPVAMALSVLAEEGGEALRVYASRGTTTQAPPLEERLNAVQRAEWENGTADMYTLNVSFNPEILPTTHKLSAHLSYMAQTLQLSTIQLDVNLGLPEPEALARPVCRAVVENQTPWLAGPSEAYKQLGDKDLEVGRELEIVGFFEGYYQVVNTNNPSGDGWILDTALGVIAPDPEADCLRVQEVSPPELTNANRRQ